MLDAIQLSFGFSAGSFNGEKRDKEILFSYSSYTQPKVVYILNTETFDMKPLRATIVNFDYTMFETKELEYTSYDGTQIPLFMVYRKDLNLTGQNPLLLEAYGGFGSIETPGFSPGIVHFLMNDGIFAFANIRGGGDKGKAWALAGRGVNKQTSFDDFIAAAEYLINNNYTSADKLAISGASNGGLVVGAAITQRPELFKVAVPIVAPMDMIRFEKFTIGHLHNDEYGSVSDSAGFSRLLAYSPLHNIDENISYPAMLIMTSENDDRVPPFHSYKFAAKMQNLASQKNPVLLRTEQNAGHYGAEGSFKKHLREEADMYDFILYHLLYQ
jgi:prolyl oligopeptidase